MPNDYRGFIADLTPEDDQEKIFMEFRYNEALQDGVEANYEDVDVRGRSEPHGYYQSTGWNQWQFSLQLIASADQNDGRTPLDNWLDYRFLKAFAYPDYDDADLLVSPPHIANIRIGRMFNQAGRIEGFSATLNPPFQQITQYPYLITVSFTFTVIHTRPISARDIRSGINQP